MHEQHRKMQRLDSEVPVITHQMHYTHKMSYTVFRLSNTASANIQWPSQVMLDTNKLHCLLDLCSYPPGVGLGPVNLGRGVGIVGKGSQTRLGRTGRRCW